MDFFGIGIKDEKRHLNKEFYVKDSSQEEKRLGMKNVNI
jgi:hypothetical protein